MNASVFWVPLLLSCAATAAAAATPIEVTMHASGGTSGEVSLTADADESHVCALFGAAPEQKTYLLSFNKSPAEALLDTGRPGLFLTVAGVRPGKPVQASALGDSIQASVGGQRFFGFVETDPSFHMRVFVDAAGTSGTFTATHLVDPSGKHAINLEGTWRCTNAMAANEAAPPPAPVAPAPVASPPAAPPPAAPTLAAPPAADAADVAVSLEAALLADALLRNPLPAPPGGSGNAAPGAPGVSPPPGPAGKTAAPAACPPPPAPAQRADAAPKAAPAVPPAPPPAPAEQAKAAPAAPAVPPAPAAVPPVPSAEPDAERLAAAPPPLPAQPPPPPSSAAPAPADRPAAAPPAAEAAKPAADADAGATEHTGRFRIVSRTPCRKDYCPSWFVTDLDSGRRFDAAVDLAPLDLEPGVAASARAARVALLVTGEARPAAEAGRGYAIFVQHLDSVEPLRRARASERGAGKADRRAPVVHPDRRSEIDRRAQIAHADRRAQIVHAERFRR